MGILVSHMESVEEHLLSISRIPANSGHPLHKGTPREAFVREYLRAHLSEQIAVGTGEIIDAESEANEPRNQIDVILYRPNYPRLDFGGGINGFLVESVVATIEVKSKLSKKELRKGIRAATNIKDLKRNVIDVFHAGHQPPGVLSYVVAYDGPKKMTTVHKWIRSIHESEGIDAPALGASASERASVQAPSLDGVFVLGKGFAHFDNAPVGFINDDIRTQCPGIQWTVAECSRGALFALFMQLTAATSGISGSWLDISPYLAGFGLPPDALHFAG